MLKNVTTQEHLRKAIHILFPDKDVRENERAKASILSPSGFYLELDFWIPELKLAFEFQDQHHYVSAWYFRTTWNNVKRNDEIKKIQLEDRGETLIIIPCWWDGSIESLKETIRLQRPELVTTAKRANAMPIDQRPPTNFFIEWKWRIPGVGEVLLPSTIRGPMPTHFWITENYDGVRACWHPVDRILYSRYSKPIPIPRTLLQVFGKTFIDGELWFGRASSTKLRDIQEKEKESNTSGWELSLFLSYDLPDKPSHSLPFEKRFATLVTSSISNDYAILVPHLRGKSDNREVAKEIIKVSGNHLLLRICGSLYEESRSDSLKYLDAPTMEALVLSINYPTCTLLLPNREIASATLTDGDLQLGDVVLFSHTYEEKVVRVKEKCEESLWNPESPTRELTKPPLQRSKHGYWTTDEGLNIRSFFDSFAKSRGVDPLVPESWYDVCNDDIGAVKHGYAVHKHYNFSLRRALNDVYPEVSFDPSKFIRISPSYWNQFSNQKLFFDNYAKKKGFDPLVPENWYSITKKEFTLEKKGNSVISRHRNSVVRALLYVYPNIGLDESKFAVVKRGHWDSRKNRKKFFDALAASRGFDPLVPSNWYSIMLKDILQKKGGIRVLTKVRTYFEALREAYPDIGLQKSGFSSVARARRIQRKQRNGKVQDKY